MTTPTDRELLEMAAKAAGIEGEWQIDPAFVQERWFFSVPYYNQGMFTSYEWNPLREDGDALRLAVKLRLCVDISDEEGDRKDVSVGTGDLSIFKDEGLGKDHYAATRRAIVRAAAEIGRAMP